jgi:N-methylhydantoinase A
MGARDVDELVQGFHQEHEKTYGHMALDEPVEIVNLRMTASGKADQTKPARPVMPAGSGNGGERDVYFGPDHGLLRTPVLTTRSVLDATGRPGPMIVEEYDATVVVPPDCSASLDEWDNIVIEVA